MSWIRLLCCLPGALALLAGCAAPPPIVTASIATLRLIGMQQLAPDQRAEGALVGGISGMDYDASSGTWLLISDNRGEYGPTRFYRVRMALDANTVGPVAITATVMLRRPDGSAYPAWGQAGGSADIESVRIDPLDRSIWYSSEGDRKAGVPSFVHRVDAQGLHGVALPYPASLQIQPDCACGGRSNMGVEGLSFSYDGQHLWMAMEAPLIEDGPVAGPGQGGMARLSLVGRDGHLIAQYGYALDATPEPAFKGGFVDRGVTEILALGPNRLLLLERAGRQIEGAHFEFAVRLYEIDLSWATRLDPQTPIPAMTDPPRPASRRLLFDSAQLSPGWRDNYEAMAWGPPLANGARSLVLASDNNFGADPTRFLVFDAGTPRTPVADTRHPHE